MPMNLIACIVSIYLQSADIWFPGMQSQPVRHSIVPQHIEMQQIKGDRHEIQSSNHFCILCLLLIAWY